jgi:hypothetical protein
MKKEWLISILLITLLPLVTANPIPIPTYEPAVSLVVFLILETLVAYLLLRKKIKFPNVFGIILVANLATFFIGFILTLFYYAGSLLSDLIVIFIGFFISVSVEFGIICSYLRKKLKNPRKEAFKVSLIMNIASYALIISFLVFLMPSNPANPECIEFKLSIENVNVTEDTITIKRLPGGEDREVIDVNAEIDNQIISLGEGINQLEKKTIQSHFLLLCHSQIELFFSLIDLFLRLTILFDYQSLH